QDTATTAAAKWVAKNSHKGDVNVNLRCPGRKQLRGVFEKCLNHFPATCLTTPQNRKLSRNTAFQKDLTTQLPKLELTLTPATGRVPTLISQPPGPSRKRSRSPPSPFYPDATTFSDGKPASETSELNPEDVTARLEDIEVEIDTLRADTEDKELLISELQDSLTAAESEISILQMRADDAENRHTEDHKQIQKILAYLGL
ncbi:hypothetical protein Tco_1050387, partial [Tanacetum coccineum]